MKVDRSMIETFLPTAFATQPVKASGGRSMTPGASQFEGVLSQKAPHGKFGSDDHPEQPAARTEPAKPEDHLSEADKVVLAATKGLGEDADPAQKEGQAADHSTVPATEGDQATDQFQVSETIASAGPEAFDLEKPASVSADVMIEAKDIADQGSAPALTEAGLVLTDTEVATATGLADASAKAASAQGAVADTSVPTPGIRDEVTLVTPKGPAGADAQTPGAQSMSRTAMMVPPAQTLVMRTLGTIGADDASSSAQSASGEGGDEAASADALPDLLVKTDKGPAQGASAPLMAAQKVADQPLSLRQGMAAGPIEAAQASAPNARQAVELARAALPVAGDKSSATGLEAEPENEPQLRGFGDMLRNLEAARQAEALSVTKPASSFKSPLAASVAAQLQSQTLQDGTMTIRLRPHGMGVIEVEVARSMKGDAEITLRVHNPLVLEALRAERHALADIMAGQGPGSLSMELFLADRGAGQEQEKKKPSSGPEQEEPEQQSTSQTIESGILI